MPNRKPLKNKTNNEGSMMDKRNKRLRIVALVAIFTMVGTTAVSMGLAGLGG